MVRFEVVFANIGRIIVFLGLATISCIGWSLYYRETGTTLALAGSAAVFLVAGFLMQIRSKHEENLTYREGFAVVTLGWIITSLFATLPYLLSGSLPDFAHALFESVSGLTTTGGSVYADVESLSRGILFYRSLTLWLGGMGIIVLFVALMANLGFRANQLFRAELPGHILTEKINPRISETAKTLWITYVLMSFLLIGILCLLDMPLFDSMCYAFGTMATGGFAIHNSGIAYYNSPQIEWVILIFMFLSGTNYALHYSLWHNKSFRGYLHNSEFKLYLGIIVSATLLVMASLSNLDQGLEPALRNALFHVVSICTTTGFATVDFAAWPFFSQGILLVLIMIGGCAGSTAGSIKVGRYQIMLTQAINETRQMIHPKAVSTLKVEHRIIKPELVNNILQFFFLYIMLIIAGTLVLTACDLDIISSLSGALACVGNTGSGLNELGPLLNFSRVPDIGLYSLTLLMLLGRLEIFPLLLLVSPVFWKR